MCSKKGYALADVLNGLTFLVTVMELCNGILVDVLDGLASGTDEKIQTASLFGVFSKASYSM